MKKTLLFISILFIIGCTTRGISPPQDTGDRLFGRPIWTREYQGCEYMNLETIYIHKGNCKNPIHKCPCKQ